MIIVGYKKVAIDYVASTIDSRIISNIFFLNSDLILFVMNLSCIVITVLFYDFK